MQLPEHLSHIPTLVPSPNSGKKPHGCRRTGTEAMRHTGLCGQAKARKETPHGREIRKECQAWRKELRKTLKLLVSTEALK